jgi:hypothetical protein
MTGGDSPDEVDSIMAEADLKVDCAANGSALAGFAPGILLPPLVSIGTTRTSWWMMRSPITPVLRLDRDRQRRVELARTTSSNDILSWTVTASGALSFRERPHRTTSSRSGGYSAARSRGQS